MIIDIMIIDCISNYKNKNKIKIEMNGIKYGFLLFILVKFIKSNKKYVTQFYDSVDIFVHYTFSFI